MDDVIFAHNLRLLNIAAELKRSAHVALSLAINGLSKTCELILKFIVRFSYSDRNFAACRVFL